MNNSETVWVFQFNKMVLNTNLKDITHAESLVSPASGGNSINWTVGHILVSRDDIREMIGLKRLYDGKEFEVYKRGSDELKPADAVDLNVLFSGFNDTHKEIEDKISETDYSDKQKDLRNLTFLAFHEAYHVGQTGILRRIAGKEGAIK